jgi:cell wall-associated NlpC family hydrolase
MFSKPSSDADVVSQAIYSTTVEIVKSHGEWSDIRTPDDYTGWVETAALRALHDESYPATQKVAQIESLRAHIYREASVTKHAPLVSVPFETRLEVLHEKADEEKRWIEVRLPDGATGWVQRGDVSLDPKALEIPELVELSRRFLGLPYTWGGSSAQGYDCSGFTQMLCRRGGVEIPRDAQPQADWKGMTKVERAGLQAGDLLYFGAEDHAHGVLPRRRAVHPCRNARAPGHPDRAPGRRSVDNLAGGVPALEEVSGTRRRVPFEES